MYSIEIEEAKIFFHVDKGLAFPWTKSEIEINKIYVNIALCMTLYNERIQ